LILAFRLFAAEFRPQSESPDPKASSPQYCLQRAEIQRQISEAPENTYGVSGKTSAKYRRCDERYFFDTQKKIFSSNV